MANSANAIEIQTGPPENCQERLPVCVGGAGAGWPQETGRWQKEGATRQMKCQGNVQR